MTRFMLYLPPELLAAIKQKAAQEGRSCNNMIIRLITQAVA